jgi:hypothetical protein
MRAFFSAADGTQDNAFSIDLEPAQFRGARSAFGAYLLITGLLESDPTKARPLEIGGVLSWPSDGGTGLLIPPQLASGGTTGLVAPISDAQLASIEERRAGGEPNFEITLTALARRSDGTTGSYRLSWSSPFLVPRDRWKDALAACGYGRIHIVELPVPPEINDAWARSALMLARASAEFGEGRYGETMGNARNALQEMVGVLERALSIGPKHRRVRAPGKRRGRDTDAASRASQPGSVRRAGFRHPRCSRFSSDPMHRGYDLPNREDAAFALALATALHAFLARRPIPGCR